MFIGFDEIGFGTRCWILDVGQRLVHDVPDSKHKNKIIMKKLFIPLPKNFNFKSLGHFLTFDGHK